MGKKLLNHNDENELLFTDRQIPKTNPVTMTRRRSSSLRPVETIASVCYPTSILQSCNQFLQAHLSHLYNKEKPTTKTWSENIIAIDPANPSSIDHHTAAFDLQAIQ
ncbi:hypothetical protein T10_8608 [Trichinella papuae]|uniref:Uncharacterized protein n=1 Tax=Trichinella papuae TaxID=268474 RepID=A0A0V1MM88_9BILA|nr:hypothetical protein T10_8608 [Trichinella papuae]